MTWEFAWDSDFAYESYMYWIKMFTIQSMLIWFDCLLIVPKSIKKNLRFSYRLFELLYRLLIIEYWQNQKSMNELMTDFHCSNADFIGFRKKTWTKPNKLFFMKENALNIVECCLNTLSVPLQTCCCELPCEALFASTFYKSQRCGLSENEAPT